MDRALAWTGLGLTALFPLSMLRTRAVAVDESEFFAATIRVREGLMPYRDFWEHHLPLQWYLMAPWARLSDPPSIQDVIRIRGLQSLLWLLFGVAFISLLRRHGVTLPAALGALSLLVSSTLFSTFAVEYRIDTPMNVFFFLGLLLSERSLEETGGTERLSAGAAGVAFALAALFSQRMVPVAMIALVLYAVVRRGGRWGFRPAFGLAWAAASSVVLVFVSAFSLGGGFGELIDQNVIQNASYETLAVQDGGVRISALWPVSLAAMLLDIGFFILLLLSAAAMLAFRRRLLSPCPATRFFVLLLGQVVLLSRIRSPNPYQLGTAIALLAVLAGLSAGAAPARFHRLAAAGMISAAIFCSGLAWARTDQGIQVEMARFQEHVLSRVSRSTGPGDTVLDGCGLAWNRESTLDLWFLRPIALSLTRHGLHRPVNLETLERKRPAIVIADYALLSYVPLASDLGSFLARNYLPLERVLWIPAPNARLAPGESASWTIVRTGAYAVTASVRLAEHPWFRTPLTFPELRMGKRDAFALDLSRAPSDPGLVLSFDGRSVALPSVPVWLVAGTAVVATNQGPAPLGVFLRPEAVEVFFGDPFPSVPLWAAPEAR